MFDLSVQFSYGIKTNNMKGKYKVIIVSTGHEKFESSTMIVIMPSVASAAEFVENTLSSLGLGTFEVTNVEWIEDVDVR